MLRLARGIRAARGVALQIFPPNIPEAQQSITRSIIAIDIHRVRSDAFACPWVTVHQRCLPYTYAAAAGLGEVKLPSRTMSFIQGF